VKIVLAPDSFKGSLSALAACQALQNGAARAFPGATFEWCPLADGGEGTLEALIAATGGFTKTLPVRGPLGEDVEANWGILPDGKGVIEMAQASGLTLSTPERRDALAATTWGTGQLIKAALVAGCREILVGLGGSATTDGGAGALSALGAIFRDRHQVVLRPGGAALAGLESIDLRYFNERLSRASLTLLCDVTNPLCGPHGAARIYGPQKGASPEDVEVLDGALARFALVAQKMGHDVAQIPGAGAAGGLAFGLMAFAKAQVRSGIEVVLEASGFAAKLEGADMVLTGEGSLDTQTLQGKTIAGVCHAARAAGVPVVAFGGRVELSSDALQELGLQDAFAIADPTRELSYNMEHAAELLETAVENHLRSVAFRAADERG
jgi:glycerate kinase